MSELDQTILKLRLSFHRRLAERLGLRIDEQSIKELAQQMNDQELFKRIEIDSREFEITERLRGLRLPRFACESKLIRRSLGSFLVWRSR